MNRRYCSIKEASEYTSLPIKTLYEWAGQGRIPSIKIGRRVLFDLCDIDQVMGSFKRTKNKAKQTVSKIIGEIQNNEI
jgi:excisionase family DNA binding protein|tara:strand:+ start:1031 stop:1264 length:234 start_codon:yes stop_codon:yes gene_type:complete